MFEFVSANNSSIYPTSVRIATHRCQTAKINIKIDISNFFGHNFIYTNELTHNLRFSITICNQLRIFY